MLRNYTSTNNTNRTMKKLAHIVLALLLIQVIVSLVVLIQFIVLPAEPQFDFLLSQRSVGIKSQQLRQKCQVEGLQITTDVSPNETGKKCLQTLGCRGNFSHNTTSNETPTTLCQWAQNATSLSEYERYTQV